MNLNQKIAIAKKLYPVGTIVRSMVPGKPSFEIKETTRFTEHGKRGLFAINDGERLGGSRRVYISSRDRNFAGMKLIADEKGWACVYAVKSSTMCVKLPSDLGSDQTASSCSVNISYPKGCDIIEGEATHLTPEQMKALSDRIKTHERITMYGLTKEERSQIDFSWDNFFRTDPQFVVIVDDGEGGHAISTKPNQDLRESMAEAAADNLPGLHDQEDKTSAQWPAKNSTPPVPPMYPPLRDVKYPSFQEVIFWIAMSIVGVHIIAGLVYASKLILEWQ